MKTPTRHLTATRRHITRLIAIGAAAVVTAGLAGCAKSDPAGGASSTSLTIGLA